MERTVPTQAYELHLFVDALLQHYAQSMSKTLKKDSDSIISEVYTLYDRKRDIISNPIIEPEPEIMDEQALTDWIIKDTLNKL